LDSSSDFSSTLTQNATLDSLNLSLYLQSISQFCSYLKQYIVWSLLLLLFANVRWGLPWSRVIK
jgi:hypothetical protein